MTYTIQDHIDNVETLMIGARQTVAKSLRIPPPEERILRAKLIYEEALETIEALGVDFVLGKFINGGDVHYNPEKILDGACDLAVVTNGTLIACGLQSVYEEALERVDQNNLTKVGPGAVWREDGKMLKPPGYKPVELKDLIEKAKS